jgi:Protein of unknown function (DUF2865)
MALRIGKLAVLRTSAFALTAAATLAATVPADAQSNYCASLQADYLSAVRGSGGGSGDIRTLRSQLAAAEADARNNNCRRFLFFGRRPSPNCPSIMSNVYRLQRQVTRASGGAWGTAGQASFDRNRLYNQLRQNGCDIPSLGDTASSGYRTICVRTCDGYYFPISFSASRARFKVDETVCKSMYGGADAELFVYPNGRTADQAVSLAGTPLASEPYAFTYRTTFDSACRTELTDGLANLAIAFAARVAGEKANRPSPEGTPAPLLPAPVARVNPNEDYETLANAAGGFVVAPVTPDSPDELSVATANTPIRRLGPEYYYRAPEKIEALYEAPDLGPEFSLISSAHADERHQPGDGGAAPATSVQ